MNSKKINLLLKRSDGSTESFSFVKQDILIGSSEIADIKVSEEGVASVFCRLVLENGRLKIDPVDGGQETYLGEGQSFSFGVEDSIQITFESYSMFSKAEETVEGPTSLEVLSSADKMAASKSDLADVEAEAENYLHSVKVAEARLSQASQKADIQFQSKLSQSSARAHRILEQTTKDIESLTIEAQKKVHYLNHEIEEKSAQLHKTILFLEGQTAQKQESLDSMRAEIEEIEFKKVAVSKDIRMKQQEFSALQAEYANLVNSKKDEILHLTQDANKKREDLQEVNEKLIIEEKRFDEKTYILKKNISNLETESQEKEKLLSLLKENYRNLEEDLEALHHDKEKAAIKVKEEEGILEVLVKKKNLIKTETERIIGQSKEEAMNLTKAAVLKAENMKREATQIKEAAEKEAKEMLVLASKDAEKISKESKTNAQKLIDVAKVDAREALTSAESKLEQAQLDYNNKIKEAEAEAARLRADAQTAKDLMLKEIETKRKEQVSYINEELRKFKEGLSVKKAAHLKLVSEEEAQGLENSSTGSTLEDFGSLIEVQNDQVQAKEESLETAPVVENENVVAKEEEKETANEAVVAKESVEGEEVAPEKLEDNQTESLEASFEALEDQKSESTVDDEDALNEIPQAVASIKEEEQKSEEGEETTAEVAAKDSFEEELKPAVVKEKIDFLKPLREAVVSGIGFFKSTYSHPYFKVVVPAALLVALTVMYTPKLLDQIKQQREIAKENNKIKEQKNEKLAQEREADQAKTRSVSSIGKVAAKAIDVYHESYTDRVLFTQDYIKNEFKPAYRSKWITEMRKFVVEKAKLPESQLAPIITTETALLRALDQMYTRSKNVDLMTKLEDQLLNKLKTQLKTDELYSEFFNLKSKFYKEEYSVK